MMAAEPTPRFRAMLPSGATLGLLVVLAAFAVLLGIKGQLGNFVSLGNLQFVLKQASVPAIVALGMLLVVVSGGIDLSVGSVVALVTVASSLSFNAVYTSSGSLSQASLTAIAVGVLTGGLCGFCNGLVITLLGVSPFVTTLGMYSIARGLAYWLSNSQVIALEGETPEWMRALEQTGGAFLFNPGVWLAALLAVLTWVMLKATVLGRHCYAIGSSEGTARLCGVPVASRKVVLYTLAGLLAGIAGVLFFARSGTGNPNGQQGLELEVIAAVVIGGASLSGGRGTVLGVLLGVFLLTTLENLLVFLRVSVDLKLVLIGVVVIFNTALARWQKRDNG